MTKKFKSAALPPVKKFDVSKNFSQWTQSATGDRLFVGLFFAWLVFVLLAAAYAAVNFGRLPDQIPLFYSRPWGESQLSNRYFLFLPIGGAFLLGIFNLGAATSFHFRDRVVSYLLAGTATLVAALSFLSVVNIIKLMS